MDVNFPVYILVFVSFLTWLVFLITLAKLSRFFGEFRQFKSTNDAELNSQVWHIKRLESEIAEIIVELRRSNKLLYEMRGAGEIPDEVLDFSRDSDVFRQEKMTGQKTKPVESALAAACKGYVAPTMPQSPRPPPINIDIRHSAAKVQPEEDVSAEYENGDEEELSTDTSIINFKKEFMQNAGSIKVGEH